jgi:hypothetical protein
MIREALKVEQDVEAYQRLRSDLDFIEYSLSVIDDSHRYRSIGKLLMTRIAEVEKIAVTTHLNFSGIEQLKDRYLSAQARFLVVSEIV